jgi:quercetin dioxygenase-like cupin family protein
MASAISSAFKIFVSLVAIAQIVTAGDPDILTDFVAPANQSIDGNFFTFTGMRVLVSAPAPTNFTVLKAAVKEFPALEGQSVSYAILEYPIGSTNPPHTHPRASELLFVIQGSLQVGFVDTTNKLFTQTLQLGDIFVFPKGLVHFQFNNDAHQPAMAVSAFGSANAGTVSLPTTLFGTGIDDTILAKGFKTDVATIQALKAGLAPKP